MPERPYTDEEKLDYKKLDAFMKRAPTLDRQNFDNFDSKIDLYFSFNEDGNLDQEITLKDANNYTCLILDGLVSQMRQNDSKDKMFKLFVEIQNEFNLIQSKKDYKLAYTKILPKLLYHDELVDFYHNAFKNLDLEDQVIRNIAEKDPKIACAIANFYLVGKELVDIASTYGVETREIKRWRRKGLVRLLDSDIKKKILS